MSFIIFVKFLLFALGGAANAVMDKLQFHYSRSIFPKVEGRRVLGRGLSFWNPEESWKNKYKNWPEDKRPKFFGAKTFLVFLTDGWHFAQFLMLTFFAAAVVPQVDIWYHWLYWFFGFRIAFSLGFTLLFSEEIRFGGFVIFRGILTSKVAE